MTDQKDYNRQLIEDFRANRNNPDGPFKGRPLLLLTTTGARSGQPRTAPMMYVPDGDRLLVIASNAGAPDPGHCPLPARKQPCLTSSPYLFVSEPYTKKRLRLVHILIGESLLLYTVSAFYASLKEGNLWLLKLQSGPLRPFEI